MATFVREIATNHMIPLNRPGEPGPAAARVRGPFMAAARGSVTDTTKRRCQR
jgi:hypothetical protein